MKKLYLTGIMILFICVFSQGTAQNSCPSGQVKCKGKCVDLGNDAKNCGACGVVCPTGYTCVAGACVLKSCPAGQVMCNGKCVDLVSDPTNCGACGMVCPTKYTCMNGAYVLK